MKNLAYILFFLVIVIAILGVLGKIPLPPSNPTPQVPDANPHTGFGIVNRSDSSTAINFDVVAPGISYRTSHPENGPYKNTTTTSIRLIRGHDLDATGDASSWSFIVRQPEQVLLVTNSRYGEKQYNWSGKYPEDEINLSRIITPRELFLKNRALIIPTEESVTNESRELSLAGNTYYLTITGQGTRDLEFDATTGAYTSP